MKDAYIVDGVRTPIGKFAGSLASVRADDLAAHVIKSLMARQSSLDPAAIDDVILGCANQAGEDNRNVARMAALLAGLPVSVPGETVNRLCASGLSAVVMAARAIAAGEGDLFIAGGVEHMTRAPYVLGKTDSAFGRNAELYDTSIGWRFVNPRMHEAYGSEGMGETAENVAEAHGISREDQDRFSAWSHEKATRARDNGLLAREIAAVPVPQKKGEPVLFEHDEFIRPETTTATLAKLRPAFRKGGSVTAGNASGINDGACGLIVASAAAVKRFGLTPRARYVASAVAGVPPRVMGIGPIEAVKKLLARQNQNITAIDIIELNEAFAAQALACTRSWGLQDDDARINAHGGAIALGHPLGMSGARLVLAASHRLHDVQGRYALTTMCIGVGQGMAALFERV